MLSDIAATFDVSRNVALRWAIRYAWDHQHTDDCSGPSQCSAAMYGVQSTRPAQAGPDTESEATGR